MLGSNSEVAVAPAVLQSLNFLQEALLPLSWYSERVTLSLLKRDGDVASPSADLYASVTGLSKSQFPGPIMKKELTRHIHK
jgi:hypothetical protein